MEPRLVTISWIHPRKGEVVETTCKIHQAEVLRALHTLGIGCGGESATGQDAACDRCLGQARGIEGRYALGLMGG
jgi:hypothetical protein